MVNLKAPQIFQWIQRSYLDHSLHFPALANNIDGVNEFADPLILLHLVYNQRNPHQTILNHPIPLLLLYNDSYKADRVIPHKLTIHHH